MGIIFVIYPVLPSSTSMLISVVLLLVFSFTSFKELNRTNISFVLLGYSYNWDGSILNESLYSFFFITKDNFTL